MTGLFILKSDQVTENCISAIRALPKDKAYEVRIAKPGKTSAQRAYWHVLIRLVSQFQGEPEERLKEALKLEWLELHEVKVNGKVFLMPPSTEDITREQYSLLIEKTLMICSILGIKTPEPSYYGYDLR
jgi:hypothetical protein